VNLEKNMDLEHRQSIVCPLKHERRERVHRIYTVHCRDMRYSQMSKKGEILLIYSILLDGLVTHSHSASAQSIGDYTNNRMNGAAKSCPNIKNEEINN